VPGKHRRHLATPVEPQAIDRNTGGQHHRLGVDRLRQGFSRTLGKQLPEVLAEDRRGFVEGGSNNRRIAIGRHHASRLRPLTWKNERERHDDSL
jgi:hypothetical protein